MKSLLWWKRLPHLIPLADEIENIIKGEVNNKAPGADEAPAELLKCNSNSRASPLELLLKAVWTQEKISWRLEKRWDCNITKERWPWQTNKLERNDLLPYISKIFLKILHHKISSALEDASSLDEAQAGFRTGRDSIAHYLHHAKHHWAVWGCASVRHLHGFPGGIWQCSPGKLVESDDSLWYPWKA